MTAPVSALFSALADPSRLGVIERLAAGPRTPTDLSRSLSVSPQALSRHLRVLRRAGLVGVDEEAQDARVRVYRLKRGAFAPLRSWLDEAEAMWSEQLTAFRDFAEGSEE